MSGSGLTRSAGANSFVQAVIARGYDSAVRGTVSNLDSGPPGRRPPQDALELHRWFQGLDEVSKRHIRTIVAEAARAAVFGCLVVLDGATGDDAVSGHPSDFALYIQTYADEGALGRDEAAAMVRLNPNSEAVEDLHDMFKRHLAERAD